MTARSINQFATHLGKVGVGAAGQRAAARSALSFQRNLRSVGRAGFTGGRQLLGQNMRPGAIRGAMIGAGLGAGRQMMANSDYGDPMTMGAAGAAVRGAMFGGMLGGIGGLGARMGTRGFNMRTGAAGRRVGLGAGVSLGQRTINQMEHAAARAAAGVPRPDAAAFAAARVDAMRRMAQPQKALPPMTTIPMPPSSLG